MPVFIFTKPICYVLCLVVYDQFFFFCFVFLPWLNESYINICTFIISDDREFILDTTFEPILSSYLGNLFR